MTRGDKGRRVFVTRINFYLHCTGTPVSMYWCFLVGKTCAMLWRTAAPQVPVWAEQRGQKSHSELQEREQMVQTFTHTQIHTFSQHKVTSMLKLRRVMAGVSNSGFCTEVTWERAAAGGAGDGWATAGAHKPHSNSLHTNSPHQCFSPVDWALPCTSPELLQTSWISLLAPAWPHTHTNNSPAPSDALFKNMHADGSLESTLYK